MATLTPECLTSVIRLKEMLEISSTFPTGDTNTYINLINSTSRAIRRLCKRSYFKYKTLTEYYDGKGIEKLLLKHWPIISITSLYDDANRDYASNSLIDADDYEIINSDGNAGIVRIFNNNFGNNQSNIKVTYVAGWSEFIIEPSLNTIEFNDGGSNLTATLDTNTYNASELATEIQSEMLEASTEEDNEATQDVGSYNATTDPNRITLSSGSMTFDEYIGYTFTFDATSDETEQGNSYEITDNGSDWIEIDHTLSGSENVTEWNIKFRHEVTYSEISHKFTITGSAAFSILWDSGSSITTELGKLLGFDTDADDSGSATYTSDEPVLGIPEDLTAGCEEWVRWLYASVKENRAGKFTESRGEQSFSFDYTNLPEHIKHLVYPYRAWRMY